MGMLNLGDIFGKAFGDRLKPKRMTVGQSYEVLMAEESDKLLDQERVVREAIQAVEQNGIVFIDEIDKICGRTRAHRRRRRCQPRGGAARPAAADRGHDGRDQARRGQDRPHPVHRLGRLPPAPSRRTCCRSCRGACRSGSSLKALDRDDFRRILTEPEASLIKQYQALLKTEDVILAFAEDAIDELATLAAEINATVENIGARRLHTVLERLLEEISFTASDRAGTTITIDAAYVHERVGALGQERRSEPVYFVGITANDPRPQGDLCEIRRRVVFPLTREAPKGASPPSPTFLPRAPGVGVGGRARGGEHGRGEGRERGPQQTDVTGFRGFAKVPIGERVAGARATAGEAIWFLSSDFCLLNPPCSHWRPRMREFREHPTGLTG